MLFAYFFSRETKAEHGGGQVTAEQPLWGLRVGGARRWSGWDMVGVAMRMQHSPTLLSCHDNYW